MCWVVWIVREAGISSEKKGRDGEMKRRGELERITILWSTLQSGFAGSRYYVNRYDHLAENGDSTHSRISLRFPRYHFSALCGEADEVFASLPE